MTTAVLITPPKINLTSPQAKIQPQHVSEWLKDSAVSETITQLNLKSIDDSRKIAKLLNWQSYRGSPGWYFRSCNHLTGKLTDKGQLKPDIKIQFPDSDKPQKYLSFPKDSDSEIICLLLALNDWIKISERVGVSIAEEDIDQTRDDLGFWQWVVNHPEIPITITEGGKKAACLLSHGWVTIALTGVWNGQQSKKLHPSLVPFIVPGREVYLAFDADIVVKRSVQDSLKFLGCLIERAKAIVRVVGWHLELGKGCDDLIAAHGSSEFERAIGNAKSYSQWLKELEEQFRPKTQKGGGGDGDAQDILKEIESRFAGRFRLNRMTGQVELDGKPIRLEDFYITLRRQLGLKAGKQFTIDLVSQLARESEYSPVVEYLERVSQQYGNSSVLLLDNLASRYFGTSEPLYNAYLKRTLIGAVARTLDPGCQVDTALILQGEQGLGKSSFFKTLAGDWFDDSLGDCSSKDERLKLRFSWILEYSELERAFSRRSIDDIKAFLSCRSDNLRVPYGRNIEAFPRHSILVGTTNRQEFLDDPTGDRRFWVVPVQQQIDCHRLAQERDRIWAAAVALYRQNEQWWLTSQEVTRSKELNQPFRVEDPWQQHIKDYVEVLPEVGGTIRVYIREVLENCLQLDRGRQEKASQMRVAAILKRLGFTKKQDSKGSSCWARVQIPQTPTDTLKVEVSVPSSYVAVRVSGSEQTPTDTFSANFRNNSEPVAQQSEAIELIDSCEKVPEVSIGVCNVVETRILDTDTSTDTLESRTGVSVVEAVPSSTDKVLSSAESPIQVGDRVQIIASYSRYRGQLGTVQQIEYQKELPIYQVRVDGETKRLTYQRGDLQLVQGERSP